MQIGQKYDCIGFVTQEKYISGQTLVEIENRLGYKTGRFSKGVWVGRLLELPKTNEFDFKGYSQVAGHRHKEIEGYDIIQLKKMALSVMKTEGSDRLVKLFPVIGHNNLLSNDEQYPPGSGIPQWNLNTKLPFLIVDFIIDYPNGKYNRK